MPQRSNSTPSVSKSTKSAATDAEGIERLLCDLGHKQGVVLAVDSEHPLLLQENRLAWVVDTGSVDIFAVYTRNHAIVGTRYHLFRCEAGQILFGAQPDEGGLALLAVGGPGSQLIQLEHAALQQMMQDQKDPQIASQLAPLIENWINGLSSGLTTENPPRQSEIIEPGRELTIEAHHSVGARELLWVRHLAGASAFLGEKNLPPMGSGYVPITSHTWIETTVPSHLQAINTTMFIEEANEWTTLDEFHHLAIHCIARKIGRIERAERQRLRAKADANQRFVTNAFRRLTSVLDSNDSIGLTSTVFSHPNPLLAACQIIGHALDVPITPPTESSNKRKQPGYDPLRAIARASRLRYRQVALQGEWWRGDHGPLLAFTRSPSAAENLEWERAVALIPSGPGNYILIEPILERKMLVNAEIAAKLMPQAFVLYRPFPEQSISAAGLIRFGLAGTQNDLWMVLGMGIAIGLLGMMTPLITSTLFDAIIPNASHDLLWQAVVALLLSGVGILLFQITRNVAVLRVEGRLSASLQAATWDRVLRLPVTFFREYTAGDLADRTMGMEQIRKILFGTAITTILAGIFSLFNFGLLFYYDGQLAAIASGLVLISAAATIIAGYAQVRYQRQLINLQGELSGMVLQFINGIPKFRVAGAEGWAFTRWAKKFSQQKREAYRSRAIENKLAVFNAVYPLAAAMVIFATVTYLLPLGRLTTGAFLGFNAAFIQFLYITLAISANLVAILGIVPIYERARPILQALPEVNEAKADPGELSGEIEVSHLSFQYHFNEPPVLREVSLQIEPGEFVALVGPSGSGKSTLMRLLMGFDAPTSGAIYYDAQDLAGLDVEAVRQQMGVVLQDGKLFAGDIFNNIVGALPLSLNDAWEAARLVGMEDDIRQMPMQMSTLVSEGGSNLSGGQRQRLLIARAIVTRPRVLFFDEATSALDNRTQSIVSESVERLRATRIVIAHRLSTIQHADRIYVLRAGNIVESGNYAQLMRQAGMFAAMARRQIA